MATTQYVCKNFGGCNKALERETIGIEDGEEPICPECGLALELLNKPREPKKPGQGLPRWLVPVAAAAVAVIGLIIFLLSPKKPVPAKPSLTAQKAVPAQTAAAPPPPPACDDRQLAEYLRTRYAADEDLRDDHIQVDVANRTVVLSGNVGSDSDRAHAQDLVRYSNCPVASIVNQLSTAPSDQALAREIHKRFMGDSGLRQQPIRVAVSHGVIILSGAVAERSMRSNAGAQLADVPGIKSVINNLEVRSNPGLGEEAFHNSGSGAHQQPQQPLTPAPSSSRPSLTGTWTGTYTACSQATMPANVQIHDNAVDDITASFQIDVPGSTPGAFTVHGILNPVNAFLTLPFGGWEHQPPGISMGNIGGLVVFTREVASSFSGTIRPPGCGQISLRKR